MKKHVVAPSMAFFPVTVLVISFVALGFFSGHVVRAEEVSTLVVNEFVFDPAPVLLSAEELETVTSPYIGRDMPVDDLYDLIAEINALYADKGFLAQTVLPPQTVDDGIVMIQPVEARIGAVIITGNEHTRSDYFRKMLPEVYEGSFINLGDMEDHLVAFNLKNNVGIRAELQPGTEHGTTDYMIVAEEPRNNAYMLTIDNDGRLETGSTRYSLQWENLSLFGYRDPMTLLITSAERSRGVSVSYAYPLTPQGDRIGATYATNKIGIISGDYKDEDIGGDSTNVGITYSRPFTVDEQLRTYGTAEGQHAVSGTYFDGHKLTENRLARVTLGYTVDRMTDVHWHHGHQLTWGHDITLDKTFIKYNGNLSVQQSLSDEKMMKYEVDLQLTGNQLLPSGQQFSLGGGSSVRGTSEGMYSGDSGYRFRIEYGFPVAEKIRGGITLDHGGVNPFKGNEEELTKEDFLTSIGAHAAMQWNNGSTLMLSGGMPIGLKGADGIRVHARLQLVF